MQRRLNRSKLINDPFVGRVLRPWLYQGSLELGRTEKASLGAVSEDNLYHSQSCGTLPCQRYAAKLRQELPAEWHPPRAIPRDTLDCLKNSFPDFGKVRNSFRLLKRRRLRRAKIRKKRKGLRLMKRTRKRVKEILRKSGAKERSPDVYLQKRLPREFRGLGRLGRLLSPEKVTHSQRMGKENVRAALGLGIFVESAYLWGNFPGALTLIKPGYVAIDTRTLGIRSIRRIISAIAERRLFYWSPLGPFWSVLRYDTQAIWGNITRVNSCALNWH